MLALETLVSAEVIYRAMLCRGHEPRARIVRNTRPRPLLERGDQSVLRQVFGNPDITHYPCQSGDEPRRLDPPDCVDCAMGIGGCHC